MNKEEQKHVSRVHPSQLGGCPYSQYIRRREFLKGGLGLAAVGAASTLSGCSRRTNAVTPPVIPTDKRARVTTVLGNDLGDMSREVLESFGGASAIVAPGETVFIKTNLCAAGLVRHDPIPTGDSTKPEIALAVAEQCLIAGAKRVYLGDAAQVRRFKWDELYLLSGQSTFAAEANALNQKYDGRLSLVCLNADSPDWDEVPSPHTGLGSIYVSSLVTRADKIISLAVIKTHRWTQVTGALKNFVGVTPISKYGWHMPWRFVLHDAVGGIEQSFLDICQTVRPHFSIIDCSICCEGNGPHVLPGWWGDTVDMRDRLGSWLLIGSDDPVAADATAARVIGHEADNVNHLVNAYNQGLGQSKIDMIDINGESLDSIRVEFAPAEPVDGFSDVIIPGIMMGFS